MKNSKSITAIIGLTLLFTHSAANAASKVCGKINLQGSNSFVSTQWQDAGDGSSCFGDGMVDIIVPANVKFKLIQQLGGKCFLTQKDNIIRVLYSLDVDSNENCQLLLVKPDGTKAKVSFLAPIGS